jgi:hypothetical protein
MDSTPSVRVAHVCASDSFKFGAGGARLCGRWRGVSARWGPAPVPTSSPLLHVQFADQGMQIFLDAGAQGLPLAEALVAFSRLSSANSRTMTRPPSSSIRRWNRLQIVCRTPLTSLSALRRVRPTSPWSWPAASSPSLRPLRLAAFVPAGWRPVGGRAAARNRSRTPVHCLGTPDHPLLACDRPCRGSGGIDY